MISKIIIKIQRNTSVLETEHLCEAVESSFLRSLKELGIETEFEVLHTKGAANIPHKLFAANTSEQKK